MLATYVLKLASYSNTDLVANDANLSNLGAVNFNLQGFSHINDRACVPACKSSSPQHYLFNGATRPFSSADREEEL